MFYNDDYESIDDVARGEGFLIDDDGNWIPLEDALDCGYELVDGLDYSYEPEDADLDYDAFEDDCDEDEDDDNEGMDDWEDRKTDEAARQQKGACMDFSLNYEQMNWICNLDKDEGDKLISLMRTGKWALLWNEEEHGFILKRKEPIVDLLAKDQDADEESPW